MKKGHLGNRKRSALCWLAALAAMMLLCDWTGIYGLTPRSALRRTEELFFTGRTTVEASFRGHGGHRIILSQNEEVVLCSIASWYPRRGFQEGAPLLGYRSGFPLLLERTDQMADAGYAWYDWDTESSYYPFLVAGCVNDARVTVLEIQLPGPDGGEAFVWPVELQEAGDGRRYFLLDVGVLSALPEAVWLEGQDIAGNEIGRQKLEYGVSMVENFT